MTLLGLLFLATLETRDLEPKVSAELSLREAFLGDAVPVSIRIVYDDQWTFAAFELPESLGEARVLEQRQEGPNRPEGQSLNTLVLHARVAWYQLGEASLPPVELTGTRADGTTQTFKTPELKIEIVKLLQEDDQELSPDKGQVAMAIPPLWPWITAGVILLILVIALIWYFRSRLQKPEAEKVVPALPPYDEALERLNELTHGSFLKEGRVKDFYVEINLIIRHYYARLYNINAEEMTGFELEEWIADTYHLPGQLADLNRMFQEQCDRVKFAEYDPVEAENKEAVNWAYQIVELLKPQIREEGSHVAAG